DGGGSARDGRHRRAPRGRARRALLALLAVVAVAAAAWSVPDVREELRASFTRLPSTYTELYFTRAPGVERGAVVVPVSLVGHGEHADRTHRLRVWLETSGGRVTASVTAAVPGREGRPASAVVRLPVRRGDAPAAVRVALLGHDQTLRYRLTGRPNPDSEGTP
ncbi:hypothetical protein RKE29_29365, partial [Streptomyces sp. B1866]|uniref:hypothetical protein n=1 Tax=Streptomyces sp. B1866 TaxID=3075431 RepID=UPI0028912D17